MAVVVGMPIYQSQLTDRLPPLTRHARWPGRVPRHVPSKQSRDQSVNIDLSGPQPDLWFHALTTERHIIWTTPLPLLSSLLSSPYISFHFPSHLLHPSLSTPSLPSHSLSLLTPSSIPFSPALTFSRPFSHKFLTGSTPSVECCVN